MTPDEFKASLDDGSPPEGISHALAALWYDMRDDWASAHAEAQAQEDATGAWVHAYLHRVEGDLSNAAYWYRRAGKPVSQEPLSQEREQILADLLSW